VVDLGAGHTITLTGVDFNDLTHFHFDGVDGDAAPAFSAEITGSGGIGLQNVAFLYDAGDIDGDGIYNDNPTVDQSITVLQDATNTAPNADAVGTAPTLDVDGINGNAAIDFSGTTGGYTFDRDTDVNDAAFAVKTFTFTFETGSSISGIQTIYEQGGGSRSFGLFIDDTVNPGVPTLYGVAYNNVEWDAAGIDAYQVLDLGPVAATTTYNVVLELDASANPTAPDVGNTWTGYVDGVEVDQLNNVFQMAQHSGDIGIGIINDGAGRPNDTTANSGNDFKGQIGELASWNRVLSSDEITQLSDYYDAKWNNTDTSTFYAAEDVANNTQVGAISAEDAAASGLTVTLENDGGGLFTIDGNGNVVLTSSATILAENNANYAFTARAEDADGNVTYKNYVVEVIDTNTDTANTTNQTLTGDGSANNQFGAAGNDTIDGGAGDDQLFGGLGIDSLIGGDDDDFLFGDVGADILEGGAGSDTLLGGDGADNIIGGAGADMLEGGAAADNFIFTATDSTMVTADIIFDYNDSEDIIDLSDPTFGALAFGGLEITTYTLGSEDYTRIEDNATGFVLDIYGDYLSDLDAADFTF